MISGTGKAGTGLLCHPFLVHAAQQHRSNNTKFKAQPPLPSKNDFNIDQPLEASCAIEKAIIKGIRIYNLLGEIIRSYNNLVHHGDNFTLDLSGIVSGYYFIEVEINEKVVSQRFSILR